MNATTGKILKMLRNEQDHLSGEKISVELGITRTAVWKHIRALRRSGYTVDAIQNRGYRIMDSPDLLIQEELQVLLRTKSLGERIFFQKEIDSTNRLAMTLASDGAPHGTVVTSDSQTGGRGRRGRSWFSPPGSNLYMSVVLRPSVSPLEASQIPIISVIATLRALSSMTEDLLLGVKWPNDIHCRDRKLSGTLCEMKSDMDQVYHVVVGIGVNVNMMSMDNAISDTATSMKLETGIEYSRTALAVKLLEELEIVYDQWLSRRNLNPFMDEWEDHSILTDRKVGVETSSGTVHGIVRGITDGGALNLELPDGTIQEIFAGDAHLTNHS